MSETYGAMGNIPWDTDVYKRQLYNNTENPSKPTSVADNKLGDWNTFYIKMVGDRVTVVLNGQKVVDNVMLENFWDRSQPIFPIEQIELQAHGTKVYFRNLYINELPQIEPTKLSAEEQKEGFRLLYDEMCIRDRNRKRFGPSFAG